MTKQAVESQQQGCRWLHNPPSGEEFAAWFETNVPVHAGLNAADYVNGVTLIPNKEKTKVTRLDDAGNTAIVEIEQLVFSPYPQVETRVRYFWDYCRENGYLGTIKKVAAPAQSGHLPAGVTLTKIRGLDGKDYAHLSSTCQVHVYERDLRSGNRGRAVIEPPAATKTVALHGRFGPDVNAIMKAETGAIGRALGFAGMLIIPGAGISTAEDMHEFTAEAGTPSVPGPAPEPLTTAPQAQEPLATPTEDQETVLRSMATELASELQQDHPLVWEGITLWATERGLDLENPPPASLRALERQLRRKLDAAKAAQK